MAKKYDIICLNCGKEVSTYSNTIKFCSRECSFEYNIKTDKYRSTCKRCGKIFSAKQANVAFCCVECKEAYNEEVRQKNKKEPVLATCICGKEFVTSTRSKKYCSVECRDVGSLRFTKKEKKPNLNGHEVSQFEFDNRDLISDIFKQFSREKDFQDFINQFYYLFGFRNILKCDPYFPDIVAIDKRNVIHRIEVEYHAYNFIAHGHDPRGCDFIYSVFSHTDVIKNVPVRYFLKTAGVSIDRIIDFGNILLPLHFGVLS